MPFFRNHKPDGSVEISGVPDESPQPPDEPVEPDIEALQERALRTRNDLEAALYGPGGYDSDEWLGATTALLTSLEKEIDTAQQSTITSLRTWIKENAYHSGEWCPAWNDGQEECECGFYKAALGEGEFRYQAGHSFNWRDND